MARYITVGAAQSGPVSLSQSRSQVVDRLLDQMRQDKLIRAMNVQSSAFANRIIHNEKDFSFKEN